MALDREKIRAASEAAERWLGLASAVTEQGRIGGPKNIEAAYTMLCDAPENLEDGFHTHDSVLREAFDELRAQSDAPVRWGDICVNPGPGFYPHVWSSAHEAAREIAMFFLSALVWPLADFTDAEAQEAEAERLLATRGKALTMRFEQVTALQERIRRERAKLLAQTVLEWKPAELKPLSDPGDSRPSTSDRWLFTPGLTTYCGTSIALTEMEQDILRVLAKARVPVTTRNMRDEIPRLEEAATSDGAIRAHLCKIRTSIRGAFRLAAKVNPVPLVSRGERSAWKLDMSAISVACAE